MTARNLCGLLRHGRSPSVRVVANDFLFQWFGTGITGRNSIDARQGRTSVAGECTLIDRAHFLQQNSVAARQSHETLPHPGDVWIQVTSFAFVCCCHSRTSVTQTRQSKCRCHSDSPPGLAGLAPWLNGVLRLCQHAAVPSVTAESRLSFFQYKVFAACC